MEVMNIIWLGCGALAVMFVAGAIWAWVTKEISVEANEAIMVDFRITFFGSKTGCHGTFFDEGVSKNGVLINADKGSFKVSDLVRAIVRGRKDGNWQLEAIMLTNLSANTVVVTGEKKFTTVAGKKVEEGWVCLYPNDGNFALVGFIKTEKELKPNKKYAVKKESDGVFTLA